jgi:MFS family permease
MLENLKRLKKLDHKQTFASLRHPNYKLWFWGQMISLFGTWMQTTAQGYLVFELTHSSAYLGYVGFALGVPTWIFTLYGGVIADRLPRRNVLIATQIFMMILAVILAVLTFMHVVQAWHIVILAFGLGIANSFDAPARQAFVLELVEREDLVNAIALNSTMFNTATAFGPAIAGITYAEFGPSWCFIINAVSFIGVIIALALMKLKKPEFKPKKSSAITELKNGFTYIRNERIVYMIILLIAAMCFLGIAFGTLIPAWAVKVLHGGARTNGLLQSARGFGSLMSALFIASISKYKFKGKLLTAGTFAFPVLLIIFSFITWLPLSILILVAVGASSLLVFNLANGIIQTVISDEYRGRVMALYSITFFGFMPLGALFVGATAQRLGESTSILINSSILLIFVFLLWLLEPKLKKIS